MMAGTHIHHQVTAMLRSYSALWIMIPTASTYLVKDSAGTTLTSTDAKQAPTDGIVRFFVTAANMASAPAGLYVYDIEMTDNSSVPSNKVTTLIYGTFKINEDVSV